MFLCATSRCCYCCHHSDHSVAAAAAAAYPVPTEQQQRQQQLAALLPAPMLRVTLSDWTHGLSHALACCLLHTCLQQQQQQLLQQVVVTALLPQVWLFARKREASAAVTATAGTALRSTSHLTLTLPDDSDDVGNGGSAEQQQQQQQQYSSAEGLLTDPASPPQPLRHVSNIDNNDNNSTAYTGRLTIHFLIKAVHIMQTTHVYTKTESSARCSIDNCASISLSLQCPYKALLSFDDAESAC
jgi:hypothetical protein